MDFGKIRPKKSVRSVQQAARHVLLTSNVLIASTITTLTVAFNSVSAATSFADPASALRKINA